MACLNDMYFLDADERAKSLAFARRGISMPEEIKLRPGQILFRFAHSTRQFHEGVAGAWWITDSTFDYLKSRALDVGSHQRADRAVRSLYRQKVAVPARFGPSDMVVRAVAASPIRAWTGRGRDISDTESGGQERYIGAFEVAQLCIPGLMVERSPGSSEWIRSPTYDTMLINVSYTPAEKLLAEFA